MKRSESILVPAAQTSQKRSLGFTAMLSLLLWAGCTSTEVCMKNPNLKSLRPDYAGNTFKGGRFVEPIMSEIPNSPWPILRWKLFTSNPKASAKKQDTFRLTVRPVPQLPSTDRDYLIWLGHATYLLHLDGRFLLTDPCLFAPPMMKRFSEVPLDIRSVPLNYLLISHGHYDHLDAKTLAELKGDSLTALVPLNMGPLVSGANADLKVQEAGWYQRFETPQGLAITLLPAKHWNRRNLADFNSYLWGSFLIQWKNKSIYFAGDTGYAPHFSEIARLAGPLDYALLPIAAYDPPFIMQTSHLNPEEALQAFKDLGAKHMIPMHYGTFDLSDEPLGEPPRRLKSAAEKQSPKPDIQYLDVGEILFLE